jgi:mono/diheme cytochrome c family protein
MEYVLRSLGGYSLAVCDVSHKRLCGPSQMKYRLLCQKCTCTFYGLQFSTLCEGKMFERITRKYRVGAIALLPLFLFAFPHFAAAQSDGQKLFDTNCAKCHGADGTGNTVVGKAVGAKDLGGPEAKKLTDADIRMQIEQGKGNMPPFGGTLNKAQIDSLIPIVRGFGKKTAAAKKPS